METTGNTSFVWCALLLGIAAQPACGSADDAEATGVATTGIGSCFAGEPGVRGLVCAVGESGGRLAINFNGAWFSLADSQGSWAVANNVSAQQASVTPEDPAIELRDLSSCACETRDECMRRCGFARPPRMIIERRRFVVQIAGRVYRIEARETRFDERLQPSCRDTVDASRDLVFEIQTTDPADGSPWTVILSPRRFAASTTPQNEINESATEPGVSGRTGSPGTLFAQGNVSYLSDVEIMSAVKTGDAGQPEATLAANPALHRAIEDVLRAPQPVQNEVRRDDRNGVPVVRTNANVLSRVGGSGSGATLFDIGRITDLWLDDRRGGAGWSTPGNDRPTVESTPRSLRFRKQLVDKTVRFPFLAGICGLEVNLDAYVMGRVDTSSRACFDGTWITTSTGSFEAGVKAGAGLGCNLVVAGASAGVEAGVVARGRYEASVGTDGHLRAQVRLYSVIRFNGFFKVRVLFWSKKWEATIAERELFNRASPMIDLGAPSSCGVLDENDGTCTDPASSCDANDDCVRWDLAGETGDPSRVVTGPCNHLRGGQPAGGCFPQAVFLRTPGGHTFCSGTLIGPSHVLTAAHCVLEDDKTTTPPATVIVGIGQQTTAGGAQLRGVDRVDVHPRARQCIGGKNRLSAKETSVDLAVVHLTSPVTTFPPALVARPGAVSVGSDVVRVAYGTTFTGDSTGKRRMARFSVTGITSDGTIQSRGSIGDAVCGGDSGGPLFSAQGVTPLNCGTVVPVVVGVNSTSPGCGILGSLKSNNSTGVAESAMNAKFVDDALANRPVGPESLCCPGEEGTQLCAQGKMLVCSADGTRFECPP